MKKAIVALAIAAFASTATAAISGGPHDLSNDPGATLSSCQFCHTPHYANTGAGGYADIPLWNRNTPATGAYVVNGSIAAMGAGSWTCLSCHDGVSDMGATYSTGNAGLTTPQIGADSYANVGRRKDTTFAAPTNLNDDHPVGVLYPADGTADFATRAAVPQGATGLKFYNYGAGEVVECGTCHNPHGTADGAAGGTAYLRRAKNLICADCHTK